MNDVAPQLTESQAAEQAMLAQELAAAFGGMVRFYRDYYKLSPEEARQRSQALSAADYNDSVLKQPPDQISWFDLDQLAQQDPTLAKKCWNKVCKAAAQEVRSGNRAAKVMEAAYGSRCWDRARFLALREELSREWQPRNGIERQLIDTMAQAQTSYLHWLETLEARSGLETMNRKRLQEEEGRWQAPRQSEASALEQAAGMVDRFNRIFLRTLRALRDLRRYAPVVVVQNAGQVNIGEKQVNVGS